MRRALLTIAFLVATVVVPHGAHAADELASECEYAPNGPSSLAIGTVGCIRFDSEMMGGKEPFSYYIPPACAPKRCPVLYWLHGLGGTYNNGDIGGLGVLDSSDSPWILGLTNGPPVDPRTVSNAWTYADPNGWVPRPSIDMIIVAPHGQTLPGGYGPGANRSTGWLDFNPRYSRDGELPRYSTPPPRSESMITDELIPYVEAHFPAIAGRSGRALSGVSYGGIGTGLIGLHHPDLFSALHMLSGSGFPWPQFGPVDTPDGLSLAAPIDSVTIESQGVQPIIDSTGAVPLIFLGSYGDGLSTDNAYSRWNNPPDIVGNAHALYNGKQVIHLRTTANDGVPRTLADQTDPTSPVWASLELSLANVPGRQMHLEAQRLGVDQEFLVGPGIHTGTYWRPFVRETLESLYANVQHSDGGGTVFPDPEMFDYRSVLPQFSVWGWRFTVSRPTLEFLNLTAVTCHTITLRGSGVVTLKRPATCGGGTFSVDLGPSLPVNEPYGTGSAEAYGRTVTMHLP